MTAPNVRLNVGASPYVEVVAAHDPAALDGRVVAPAVTQRAPFAARDGGELHAPGRGCLRAALGRLRAEALPERAEGH